MSETDSDVLRPAAQLARRQDLEQVSTQSLCLDAIWRAMADLVSSNMADWEISKLNGALYTVSGKITELLLEVSASHVADDTGGVNLEKLHPHVFFVCTVQMYAHVCYSICIICDHTYTLL